MKRGQQDGKKTFISELGTDHWSDWEQWLIHNGLWKTEYGVRYLIASKPFMISYTIIVFVQKHHIHGDKDRRFPLKSLIFWWE